MRSNFQAHMKVLRREQNSDRYEHSVNVMYTAAALAMAHNSDIDVAMEAGLLHDCGKIKSCPSNRMVDRCKKFRIPVTEVESKAPYLLHAKLGAYYAKKYYHVHNEAILHAVAAHSTTAPTMSMLDKIIYIADYIEPGRTKAKNLDEIRYYAFRDLDLAMVLILRDTITYLTEKKLLIDPMSTTTYNNYKKEGKYNEFIGNV